jgi:trafficking protein particle complex subunit 1
VSQTTAPTTTDLTSTFSSPRNTLSSNTGIVLAVAHDGGPTLSLSPTQAQAQTQTLQERLGSPLATSPPQQVQAPMAALPFDEEAKLVYGVLLSLRNMVKKLAGRDEQFMGYKTSTYRFHLFETPSGYKFVLLSDPVTDNLRHTLRQVH